MTRKYKVTFEVEGEMIADDMPLNKGNLEMMIKHDLSAFTSLSPFGNRSIDTRLTKLVITKK